MTLSGTVSVIICFYLAVWVPLTVAFDDDDAVAILCPSLAIMVMVCLKSTFFMINITRNTKNQRPNNRSD